MSTALSEPKLTSTVGFYNGNKWPIHLVISELNITLHLKPGEYILDTQGRKINDSFFDKYTRPLQLSKEVAKNGQVPLIAIPKVVANPGPRPAHSVTAVTRFTDDRKPIMPTPPPTPPQLAVNTPTHKGMSVDEARRLGLIGKPREVPEDYGITDTSGRPVDVHQAPPIRYAMESQPRVRTSGELPSELTQIDEKIEDPNQRAARAQLVGGLAKAATSNVESPTGFMNQATVHTPAQQIVAPSGQPAASAPQPVEESAEEPLPAPNIFAPSQVGGTPDPLAAARKAASQPPAQAPTKAPAPKNLKPFVCNVDGKDFKYRSQLETYAKRKYPDQVEAILAPYPATE